MIDLLSSSERDEIRDALCNALTTYAKTPIQVIEKGIALDPYNEGDTSTNDTVYDFLAYVEYNNGSKVKNGVNMGGAYDDADVKIMIPINQVEDAGLIVDNFPQINSTTSLVMINNEEFETIAVSLEGAFEARNVAVYIWAKRQERYAG